MIYTIEIYSRGLDVGIGTITQEQYEYWNDEDREYDLGDALNSNFDYEENSTPVECQLYDYYNEYDSVLFTFGPSMDGHQMSIKDSAGNIMYMGDAGDMINEHDPEYEIPMLESGELDYFMSVMEPGYYLQWCQGGKGKYFDGDFETEQFDPKKLKFHIRETDFGDVLHGIEYDNEVVENTAGDYDIKSFEASVHYVE